MPCLYFCINHIFIHIFKHNFATIILTSQRFTSWQYKVASYGYLKLLFRQNNGKNLNMNTLFNSTNFVFSVGLFYKIKL